PRKLAAAGIGAENSLFTYAVGRLVVWVPAASPLDPATALRQASVKHVAIANPQHAPYGRAAQAALRSLGLYQSVEPKLVLGENVAQALQFVESGAADAGIVALSLALAPPLHARGRYWEIPLGAYPRMDQGGIILKDSRAARDFRGFLLSAAGRRILKQYGFFLPGE
ncbi:MAG: molybdate ABC transporter substrate-binding protein, partial [Candidatus Solibacter sp.]|nr:molybdate ABC transporter substrate-binding protein [Candidatus Solibacter sp.]